MEIRLVLLVLGLCALAMIEARALMKRTLQKGHIYEKRNPVKVALEKRYLHGLGMIEKRDTLPAEYQYIRPASQPAQKPAVNYLYYVQNPDGTYRAVPAAQAPQTQQLLVQQAPVQAYQEVPYQEPQSSGSSGGLLNLLSKPFSTAGKVVGFAGDLVQGIVDIPFSAGKNLVSAVGLDDSLIGKTVSGVLDTGATIVKAPVELVKNVGQLPFELVSNVVQGLDEE